MSPWIVIAAGWIGQVMFFSRFFVQWWASERAKRSVAPASFWWLSLVGTLLVGWYAGWRGEAILLPAMAINAGVYLRNLLLVWPRTKRLRIPAPLAAGATLLLALVLMRSGAFEPRAIPGAGPGWYAVGVLGTALWGSRFLLQWWQSERHGQSRFTPSFWWTSLAGNALLLAYSLRLGDPLFIAGFLPGPLVQIRNLQLSRAGGGGVASGAHQPAGAKGT